MVRSAFGPRFGGILLAVAFLVLAEGGVPARSFHGSAVMISDTGNPPDHDDALKARARGEIKSLDEILLLLKPRKSDRLVDVVLDRRDGRYIYEVTWLTKLGRYRIFTIDAKDGLILKDETK